MTHLQEAARDFLSHPRIAVVGVSRDKAQAANLIYRTLRERGYEVVAVNPNADSVEGDPCYENLHSVPEPVEGVVVVTHPSVTADVVEECAELDIPRVWMHRSFGQGSVAEDAVTRCEQTGIQVIAGACPMMFLDPPDFGHRCMRWCLKVTGKLPEPHAYKVA